MGTQLRSELASTIVIGLVLQATSASGGKEYKSKYYVATIDKTENEGKCSQDIIISGNGVDDTFKVPCVDNLHVINNDELLAIGNPKTDPFSLLCFSDRSKVLIAVKNNKCTMKIYKPAEGKNIEVSAKAIANKVCKGLQIRVDKIMQKHKSESKDIEDDNVGKEEQNVGNRSLSNKFSVSSQTIEKRGKCFQDVKVEGNGVEDHIRGRCADDFQVVNNEDALVAGNPSNTPFTLFSNKDNTLVIIKDGSCEERTYKTNNGKTSFSSKELEEDECNEIEGKAKAILDENKKTNKGDKEEESQYVITVDTSEEEGKCIQKVKVTGNGIDDNFRSPCVKDLKILKKKDLMIVGDPDKDPISLFSNVADKLVIFQDGICKETTYKTVNGEIKSTSSDLEDEKCDEIVEKIKKELKNKGNSDQGHDEKSENKYEVTTNTYKIRGKCILNVTIKGNGVKEVFRGPCVDDLKIATKDVLIVGDPSKGPFSLFSDKANKLMIFKNEMCVEKTYKTEDGKTKSTPKELEEEECDKLVKKIEEALKKESETETDKDKS